MRLNGPEIRALCEARPYGGYGVIHADCPWSFRNYSDKGAAKGAAQHYACMSIDDIQAMPIEALAAEDAVLFMWAVDPMIPEAIATMGAWGFTYKTVAFTWVKTRPSGKEFLGLGYYTRANPETCLLGVRGAPGRPAVRNVRQLVYAHAREHSRKPDEIPAAIERMYPNAHKLELFARTKRPGWHVWGNQVEKFEVAA